MLVCRELNMEESVHDIMRQIGADQHGRISFPEFMRCQRKLKGEIRSLAVVGVPQTVNYLDNEEDPLEKLEHIGGQMDNDNFNDHKLTSWPTSSNNSLGK